MTMKSGEWQELAPTREEQEQRLADLNTKLCDHCLIPCHFQYWDECDLMFNPPPRILFLITELPKPEEEVLITENMLFQDPIEDTKTEQYLAYPNLSKKLELKWYSDNKEGICSERAHDTDTGFNLQYSGQSLIIIAPYSLVKIDLKIALEISVSTMVQVVSQSSLAKKEINIKVNQKIQDQALLFEASPKICSLANIANLYLLAKVHKHFKISIHNLTEDAIKIPEGTLNLPKESYLFTPEEINKLNLGNLSTLQQMQLKVLLNQYADVFASENEFRRTDIMKHQIDTRDT
ncbi:hypothetical protein G9A89_018212 [Geosiphon pyriformis]|nr:hypothetical protein G9A89_018212 [Geosiphon pyriformis]